MKTKEEIERRLNELREQYRLSSDMYNPVLQGRIMELCWVLEGAKFISHDG